VTDKIKTTSIISDANVLIDYIKSAPHVIKLISTSVPKLYVALSVFHEVDQLRIVDIKKLGMRLLNLPLHRL